MPRTAPSGVYPIDPTAPADDGRAPAALVTAVGIDLGATLVKLAIRHGDGRLELELLPRDAIDRVVARVESAHGAAVALTGGGASGLAARLPGEPARLSEFEAWAEGSRQLLRDAPQADGRPAPSRYLLTSIGTGTSVLLVEPQATRRLAGTALGGGTIAGLGAALAGTSRFDELVGLSRRGSRAPIDLLLADVYPDGDSPLPGEASASFFAKLARPGPPPAPADVAHGLMNLVGWDVGLLSAALAVAEGVDEVVYGGAALRGNEVLAVTLRVATLAMARRPLLLERGEFAGALGALARSEA